MSSKCEKLEKSMAKLTIEVDAATFEQAMERAYKKNRSKIQMHGFRRGKAPRKLIEKVYGPGIFFEDAANDVMPDAYEAAVKEHDLAVVSRPEIDIVSINVNEPFVFSAEVALKPTLTLGEYKGLEAEKQAIEVTEEEIDQEVDKIREQNARLLSVADRPITEGDQAVIDFTGFIDGEPFEGGQGQDYNLEIGSHSFIDNFEEQLIGKQVGEHVHVEVTFPETYQEKSLAGKPASFHVDIKDIKVKELPAADDELAMDVSEYDTLAEYRQSLRQQVADKKEEESLNQVKSQLFEKVVENAEVDLPAAMVDMEAENMVYDMGQRLQYQGLNLEQYFQFTGDTMDKMKERMKKDADFKIRLDLAMEAIIDKEAVEVTDEEVADEWQKRADMYNMTVEELKERLTGGQAEEDIRLELKRRKAMDLIVDSAKVVEAKEQKTDEKETKKADKKVKKTDKKSEKKDDKKVKKEKKEKKESKKNQKEE